MYIKPKSYKEICKEFGGEIKNNVCVVGGYPMDYAYYLFNNKPQSQKHISMNPDEFLSLVPIEPGVISRSKVKELKSKIKNNIPLDPLFLDIDYESGVVLDHEGRHRAIACKELNICKKVPVIIFYRNKDYGYIDITRVKTPISLRPRTTYL